jgi:hypothetical protein
VQRGLALIPRLAKGASVTIRGPVGAAARSMAVNRCLECGDYFAGPQPKQWCSDAHDARWRRRHP